jgi:hypothetical protein
MPLLSIRILSLITVVFLTTGCDVVISGLLGRGGSGVGRGTGSSPQLPALKAVLSTTVGSVAAGSGSDTRYTLHKRFGSDSGYAFVSK